MLKSKFALAPQIRFLNHGSFGACSINVLDHQTQLRQQLEAEPVQFMMHVLPELLDSSRAELANFLGADPSGLVFVPNATSGVNAVLRSLTFAAGDEIIVTNHGYNACSNAARFVAARADAKVIEATIPFPLSDQDAPVCNDSIMAAILSAVGTRTRIAVIDHVTSPTALVLAHCRYCQRITVTWR